MKKAIVALFSVSCLLWPLMTSAQGTLYASNLEQAPTGSAAIGSDYWVAQTFDIFSSDPNQYSLNSVQLLLNPAAGSPSGFDVSIWSAPLGFAPQDYLGSLAGSADPSTGGTYSYKASEITLSGGTYYFVVVTSSTPIAQAAYNWSASDSFTRKGSWAINDVYFSSSDGSSWERHLRDDVFQMAVYATIVPEPTTLALGGLGLGWLWILRRRARWMPQSSRFYMTV